MSDDGAWLAVPRPARKGWRGAWVRAARLRLALADEQRRLGVHPDDEAAEAEGGRGDGR